MAAKTAPKAPIEIKNWINGKVLAKGEESDTLKDAVVKAIANRAYLRGADLSGADLRGAYLSGADLRGADLSGADLSGADLSGADLRGAYLSGADLSGADLSGADLRGAYLSGADLRGAYLSGADLSGADLRGADLRGADLSGADLRGADLPAPTMILLACWGEVSPQLCGDLMVFDAANHPKPKAFEQWATGSGECPYDGVKVERAANFDQKKACWAIGHPCRPFDLMTRVLAEKCPPWSAEQRAEFAEKFKRKGNSNNF
jgi:hypothetical protein